MLVLSSATQGIKAARLSPVAPGPEIKMDASTFTTSHTAHPEKDAFVRPFHSSPSTRCTAPTGMPDELYELTEAHRMINIC